MGKHNRNKNYHYQDQNHLNMLLKCSNLNIMTLHSRLVDTNSLNNYFSNKHRNLAPSGNHNIKKYYKIPNCCLRKILLLLSSHPPPDA